MFLIAKVICLVACHGNSADHFAVFAENLSREGYEVQVYTTEPFLKKFQDRNIPNVTPFDKEQEGAADKIAKECSNATAVLTDVGHPFNATIHKTLARVAPEVLTIAYYDNPESYVPGGYSKVAAEVMTAAKKVLFANANLAQMPLYEEPDKELNLILKNRVGLGYYPLAQVEKIAARRKESQEEKCDLVNSGQKLLVYFGGDNEEYFKEAFPAFLKILSGAIEQADLSHYVLILQQHPGAKHKNIDRSQFEEWIKENRGGATAPTILISNETTDDMLALADGALYYQTSMGPLFVLADIPCMQVGHKTYPDILIRANLCPSITNSKDFVEVLSQIIPMGITEEKRREIYKSLGIKDDWLKILSSQF